MTETDITDYVLRDDAEGVATLTLNRPDKRNALNVDVFRALDRHLADLEAAPEAVGTVVLRANGPVFSAGADLGKQQKPPVRHFQAKTIDRLARLPQPVIAAVHAPCFTGGLELVLAADIILCAESARFADTHGKWALVPAWGMSARLPRRVGQAKAREMMFTARTIDGREAAEIGLAASCFEDTEFLERVDAIASMIAENSAFSIAAYKRLLAETDNVPLHLGLAHEVRNSAGVGPDMGERIAAFSKRKA